MKCPAPFPTPRSGLEAQVSNEGHEVMRLRATRSKGAFFSVRRPVPDGLWSQIGSVNAKRFVDRTLALGHPRAQNRVVSHRGSDASESSEPIVVLFGSHAQAA